MLPKNVEFDLFSVERSFKSVVEAMKIYFSNKIVSKDNTSQTKVSYEGVSSLTKD